MAESIYGTSVKEYIDMLNGVDNASDNNLTLDKVYRRFEEDVLLRYKHSHF